MSRENEKPTKGQVFLIGAIIIVLVLVLIRTSINVAEVVQRKSFIEAGLEKIEFTNVRNEVPKAAYNAMNDTDSIANQTNSFIAFAEDKLNGRTLALDGVSVIAKYDSLQESTDTDLDVTLYNFFDAEMSRAIVNLSTDFNSPTQFNNTASGSSRFAQFTLNLGSSQNLTMWVFYEVSGKTYVQNVTIPAEIGKTRAVGYFDVRMTSERGTFSDRFSEVMRVN